MSKEYTVQELKSKILTKPYSREQIKEQLAGEDNGVISGIVAVPLSLFFNYDALCREPIEKFNDFVSETLIGNEMEDIWYNFIGSIPDEDLLVFEISGKVYKWGY